MAEACPRITVPVDDLAAGVAGGSSAEAAPMALAKRPEVTAEERSALVSRRLFT